MAHMSRINIVLKAVTATKKQWNYISNIRKVKRYLYHGAIIMTSVVEL